MTLTPHQIRISIAMKRFAEKRRCPCCDRLVERLRTENGVILPDGLVLERLRAG